MLHAASRSPVGRCTLFTIARAAPGCSLPRAGEHAPAREAGDEDIHIGCSASFTRVPSYFIHGVNPCVSHSS